MAEYYTSTGPRPDLAALPVNLPEGYIGTKLLPVLNVADKTGTIYFRNAVARSAAQTGRGADTAPTAEAVANTSTTWTCAEAIDRAYITPDEAKNMGGVEKADQVGSEVAKVNVLDIIENAIIAKVLGSSVTPGATFDVAKILLQIEVALESIRAYRGKRVAYGSTLVLKGIVQAILANDKIGPMFSRLAGNGAGIPKFADWMNAFAMFVGVDEVMAGDTTLWNPSGYTGRFGLMAVEESTNPLWHKYRAVRGKTMLFLPDGAQPFECRSYADENALNNKYTAQAWYGIIDMNTSAQYVIDGVPTA